MATFAIDLLTSKEYLFNGNFISGGTIVTSGFTSVANGLTKYGTQARLGGLLIEDTIFNGGASLYNLKYGGDYSSNFDDRSLVDKGYVDLAISGSTPSWTTLTNKPQWLTGTTLQEFQTGHTHSYNNLTNKLSGGTGILISGNTISNTGGTTLQEITENGAITTIETTLSGGLKTTKIKPVGVDSATAIQVQDILGNNIINVDTFSGLTGFGIDTPRNKIHIFGTDISNFDQLSFQQNGIILDGVAGADKNIGWAENGVINWVAKTYRDEDGKFWYLHNQKTDSAPIVVSDTGRIGVNSPSNVPNYQANQIVGNGLDDIRITGAYNKDFISVFQVKIDDTAIALTTVAKLLNDINTASGGTYQVNGDPLPDYATYGQIKSIEQHESLTEQKIWIVFNSSIVYEYNITTNTGLLLTDTTTASGGTHAVNGDPIPSSTFNTVTYNSRTNKLYIGGLNWIWEYDYNTNTGHKFANIIGIGSWREIYINSNTNILYCAGIGEGMVKYVNLNESYDLNTFTLSSSGDTYPYLTSNQTQLNPDKTKIGTTSLTPKHGWLYDIPTETGKLLNNTNTNTGGKYQVIGDPAPNNDAENCSWFVDLSGNSIFVIGYWGGGLWFYDELNNIGKLYNPTTTTTGGTHQVIGDPLPHIIVYDLTIRNNIIYAGTSAGMWEYNPITNIGKTYTIASTGSGGKYEVSGDSLTTNANEDTYAPYVGVFGNTLYKPEGNKATLWIKNDPDSDFSDSFIWRSSYDNGENFNPWSTSVLVSEGEYELENGVKVNFDNPTGHTTGDTWGFSSFPQSPQGTFVVYPHGFVEARQTENYSANPISYTDITFKINSSDVDTDIVLFKTGTTVAATYFGGNAIFDSLNFDLTTNGVGVTLIVEYWDGTSWTDISTGNLKYIDNTNNLTESGLVEWSNPTGWTTANLPDLSGDNYNLYWLRIRSTTNPTQLPIATNISRDGGIRLATYTAKFDHNPNFYVDSIGRVSVGGMKPTAFLHLKAGTTTLAPLKFNTGDLLNTPELGAIEFDGENLYFTVTGGTGSTIRKTIADKEYVQNEISGITKTFQGSGSTQVFENGNLITIYSTPSTGATVSWGDITGTLSNQTDLNNTLTGLQSDIDDLSGATKTFQGSGSTQVFENGNLITIYSTPSTGSTATWNDITGKPQWLSATTLDGFQTGHTHSYNNLTDKLSGGTGILINNNIVSATESSSTLQLLDTTGNTNVNTIIPTSIIWTTEVYSGTSLNFSGGSRIYIEASGVYEISYSLSAKNNTGSPKNIGTVIRKNNNLDITPLSSSAFNLDNMNHTSTNIMSQYLVSLSVGDYVELIAFRIGVSGESKTIGNTSWLKIKKIII